MRAHGLHRKSAEVVSMLTVSCRICLVALVTFVAGGCGSNDSSPGSALPGEAGAVDSGSVDGGGSTDGQKSDTGTSTLAITGSLPSGSIGLVYSAAVQATGGAPAYAWSVTSGQLPPGLTLAASTGTVSGVPTTSGTFAFSLTVTDSGHPAQAVSSSQSIGIGTTWYVRPDGGTRYSTASTTGQCSGQANAPYAGTGTNQACAFNDVRYLWADGSFAGSWAISGGDTVIISDSYPSGQAGWRIGPASATTSGNCFNGYCGTDASDPSSYNPTIPAGTAGQHTRILGANYANCSSATGPTQLFGGYSVQTVLNLQGAKYVDIECLELTDHSSCQHFGSPVVTTYCNGGNYPVDDFATDGIWTDNATSDVLLQDLNIHGLPSQGLYGPIGGPIAMTRVRVAFNAFAGWNFDNGTVNTSTTDESMDAPGMNGTTAAINASYVTMEWNGCNEEYPIVDSIPAQSCYDTTSDGFGDSWSGQDSMLVSFTCDHCISRYNTKDGFIGPHTPAGTLTITNSAFYANGGQQLKFSAGWSGAVVVQNTLVIGNCNRLTSAIPGAPPGFNTNLGGQCRAGGDNISYIWPVQGSVEWDHNTVIHAGSGTNMDLGCTAGMGSVSVSSGGSGYQVGDVLVVGNPHTFGTVTVTSVSGTTVTGVGVTVPGAGSGAGTTYYTTGGHGTGALIAVNSVSNNTCNGGPRILRDNVFLGYTDTTNPVVSEPRAMWCYSDCNGQAGTTNDSMWTVRSNNIFYGFEASPDTCNWKTEVCSDPLLVGEPPQTWTGESELDNFNFSLSGTSPAKGAGTVISGMTTDYDGSPYASPPSDGAVEFADPTTQLGF
jgi:hypothetical protein